MNCRKSFRFQKFLDLKTSYKGLRVWIYKHLKFGKDNLRRGKSKFHNSIHRMTPFKSNSN